MNIQTGYKIARTQFIIITLVACSFHFSDC